MSRRRKDRGLLMFAMTHPREILSEEERRRVKAMIDAMPDDYPEAKDRKNVMREKEWRWLEKSPYVHRWPKLTEAEADELEQLIEDFRKRIEHEKMCTGREI